MFRATVEPPAGPRRDVAAVPGRRVVLNRAGIYVRVLSRLAPYVFVRPFHGATVGIFFVGAFAACWRDARLFSRSDRDMSGWDYSEKRSE